MGRKSKLKGKRNEYPKVSSRFKVGDRVSHTYHYPTEEPKHYEGTVTEVADDFMEVEWDTVNKEPMPPRVLHEWDYAVFDGGGPYSSPISKVK